MDPVKVILPAWRRGDGKPCEEPGWYAVRMNNPSGDGISEWCYKSTDDLLHSTNEYIGPVEYVVTEPEPEPLTLPGHRTSIKATPEFFWVEMEPVPSECSVLCRLSMSCLWEERRPTIEKFNAAVKAMREGEK